MYLHPQKRHRPIEREEGMFGRIRKMLVTSFQKAFGSTEEKCLINMKGINEKMQDYRNGFQPLCLFKTGQNSDEKKEILRQAYMKKEKQLKKTQNFGSQKRTFKKSPLPTTSTKRSCKQIELNLNEDLSLFSAQKFSFSKNQIKTCSRKKIQQNSQMIEDNKGNQITTAIQCKDNVESAKKQKKSEFSVKDNPFTPKVRQVQNETVKKVDEARNPPQKSFVVPPLLDKQNLMLGCQLFMNKSEDRQSIFSIGNQDPSIHKKRGRKNRNKERRVS